jgi:hypothetical protein
MRGNPEVEHRIISELKHFVRSEIGHSSISILFLRRLLLAACASNRCPRRTTRASGVVAIKIYKRLLVNDHPLFQMHFWFAEDKFSQG